MEKKVLLDTLTAHIARYEQHRHYIEKARAQAATGKFNNAVIQKVVLDHEIKSADVAEQVQPLLPQLRELVAGLEADKAQVEASRAGVDEQIQELELRAAIGEMEDADFEKEVSDLRSHQAGANERIAVIDADRGDLQAALDRWTGLAGPAGHFSADGASADGASADRASGDGASANAAAPGASASPDHAGAAAAAMPPFELTEAASAVGVEAEDDAADVEASLLDDFAVEVDSSPSEGVSYVSRPEGGREDLSALFPDSNDHGVAQVRVASVEEDIAIEAADVGEDDADASSVDSPLGFGVEVSGGEGASAGEIEIDLAGEPSNPSMSSPAPASDSGEAPRRALLLYQEGTAEEQIYPFTGDTLTIGRGRENDIQIKNDSKVSRYHCKLFRRGNNFYIEDQKSSNGSLVNGELITDRRLFGGEEIIIGETFFRFRIME